MKTNQTKYICLRYWDKNNPVFWVADIKRQPGDWGYSNKSSGAIELSEYWKNRFIADCKAVGATFHVLAR